MATNYLLKSSQHLQNLIQYFQQLHLKVVVEQERLELVLVKVEVQVVVCLLYTSPSPRDKA